MAEDFNLLSIPELADRIQELKEARDEKNKIVSDVDYKTYLVNLCEKMTAEADIKHVV